MLETNNSIEGSVPSFIWNNQNTIIFLDVTIPEEHKGYAPRIEGPEESVVFNVPTSSPTSNSKDITTVIASFGSIEETSDGELIELIEAGEPEVLEQQPPQNLQENQISQKNQIQQENQIRQESLTERGTLAQQENLSDIGTAAPRTDLSTGASSPLELNSDLALRRNAGEEAKLITQTY